MEELFDILNTMVICGELQQNREDENELELEVKRTAFKTWQLLRDFKSEGKNDLYNTY